MPSTGTRPPHHSAARTDLVRLIRRTVCPRGYASDLHSLRPCLEQGASLGKEAVLADSGRAGEVVARVGAGEKSGLFEHPVGRICSVRFIAPLAPHRSTR